jgi:hypothetical protein
MTRTYDTRPELEGYDALTVRALAKFVAVLVLIFGSQILADHYGLGGWLRAVLELPIFALGLRVFWMGARALATGEKLPVEGPRYAEPDRISFVPPRAAAVSYMVTGALLLGDAVFKFVQILVE